MDAHTKNSRIKVPSCLGSDRRRLSHRIHEHAHTVTFLCGRFEYFHDRIYLHQDSTAAITVRITKLSKLYSKNVTALDTILQGTGQIGIGFPGSPLVAGDSTANPGLQQLVAALCHPGPIHSSLHLHVDPYVY